MSSDEESFRTPIKGRNRLSGSGKYAPKSPVQQAHQREVERISEIWEGTQDELRKTSKEIRQLEEIQRREEERVIT